MTTANSLAVGTLVEVKLMELHGIIVNERWVPGIIKKLTDQNVYIKFGEYTCGWYQRADFGRTWR